MQEGLEIRVSADMSAATKSFSHLQQQMTRFERAVPSASMDKLGKKSDQAGQSLTDLSRIASDLPFGFIAIQNNLSPLVESFRRLQTQSGGTKNALSAIVSGLTGPAGVGVALSVVSAGLVFAQSGFSAWTRGLTGNKDKLKEVAERAKEAREEIRNLANVAAQEATKVTSLVAALNSGQLNAAQRKEALKDLKSINQDYFGALKEEGGIINGLNSAYEGYLNNIIAIGRTKAIEAQLTKLFAKKLELEIKIDPVFNAAISPENQKELGRLRKQLNVLGGPVNYEKEYNPLAAATNKTLSERIRLQQRINELETGRNIIFDAPNVKKEIQAIELQIGGLSKMLQNVGDFDIKLPTTTTTKEKKDNSPKKYLDELKKAAELEIKNQELLFEKGEIGLRDFYARKLKIVIDYTNKAIAEEKKLGKDADKNVITDLTKERVDAEIENTKVLKAEWDRQTDFFRKSLDEATKYQNRKIEIGEDPLKDIEKKFKERGLEMPAIPISLYLDPEGQKRWLEEQLKLYDQIKANAEAISNVLTPAFAALYDSAIDGGRPLIAFFKSLGDAVNQLMKQILTAAAQAAILALITGGTSGFAAAFAKNFKIPGFAGGTKNAPKGWKLVGEEGPELIYDGGGYPIFNNKESMDIMSGWKNNLSMPNFSSLSMPNIGSDIAGMMSGLQNLIQPQPPQVNIYGNLGVSGRQLKFLMAQEDIRQSKKF
jgi:hypothetical protein